MSALNRAQFFVRFAMIREHDSEAGHENRVDSIPSLPSILFPRLLIFTTKHDVDRSLKFTGIVLEDQINRHPFLEAPFGAYLCLQTGGSHQFPLEFPLDDYG